ncbi:MAG: tRNA glutamyl-Q(34) synthetase GluQRS [Telmatospirillum sp.]|nr:tRNA glutamyl-Q(34) synthetase GluQRS [Telmatospirillum sp.]
MSDTRFAPSPTGYLHRGHAYSALFAAEAARTSGGRFILRIEDIDRSRCRPEYTDAIFEDLAWLGLQWEQPVRRQSEHMADYQAALAKLEGLGVLYKCVCTRADIKREIAAAGAAPHLAGDGGEPLYPGTCRKRPVSEVAKLVANGAAYALRLDLAAAVAIAGPLAWHDRTEGTQIARPELLGDAVLARKDVPTSYHLAVTVDDHLQGIGLVTRGQDLFGATHLHCLLQKLLGLPTPAYHHHKLLTDPDGQRLAKRAGSASLRDLRNAGMAARALRDDLGFS